MRKWIPFVWSDVNLSAIGITSFVLTKLEVLVSLQFLREYKAKRMKDPEFAKAYEEIQPEMNVVHAIIDARISQNLTQKELAERTGIAQTEISKLENGTRNPSIKLLQRLADGMDMVLNISFTPKAAVKK